ncbi:hypothetical protein NQ314_008154 [Rhamnusium bicolor]|uniref:DUF7869 domain-containing protein n=1 Tax=Rhamnusium bicolor TaxID=1586634 RepID=A0AAV8YDR6_9CUCU|nr:hypothetical protein NQ314_008154 [Rhamnusium bicolor]
MQMKQNDRNRGVAEKGRSFRAATFDLQAILSVPFAGDNQIFYKLKLHVYNLTIFDGSNPEGHCYVWDETHGKKGSAEIGTCLLKYLHGLPETVTHVSTFSDTCGGHNRNKYVAAAMLYAVNKINHLKVIVLKFMESGHSYLEADSMHATIERARKHKTIYTTREWSVLISAARIRPKPYIVNNLNFNDFYDLQKVADTMISNVTEIKEPRGRGRRTKEKRLRETPPDWTSFELLKKFTQSLPVSDKKKRRSITSACRYYTQRLQPIHQ